MKIPKTKPGLIVTLVICASILFFRAQATSVMTMLVMPIIGEPLNCTFRAAIGSVALAQFRVKRVRELSQQVHLVEMDPKGYELYEFGSRRIWVPGGSIGAVIFDMVEQEGGIYSYGGLGARSGDIVLDAGANIGLYAFEALKQGAGKVIAIEPAPANLECLRRNLEKEIAMGKVIVYPKGIWDKDDVLDMRIDPANETGDSFVLNGDKSTVTLQLQLTTVDNMVRELQLERVDFIKMDIEGSEGKALAGAKDTIRRFHPRMAVCVYHQKDDPIAIPAIVGSIRKEYQQECGPCVCDKRLIKPQVYFYH